jgi:hypothetical protein
MYVFGLLQSQTKRIPLKESVNFMLKAFMMLSMHIITYRAKYILYKDENNTHLIDFILSHFRRNLI